MLSGEWLRLQTGAVEAKKQLQALEEEYESVHDRMVRKDNWLATYSPKENDQIQELATLFSTSKSHIVELMMVKNLI